MHRRDLKYEERQMLLELYMFLKQEQGIKIKWRTLSGGNNQCNCITKEDDSYTTVSTESVLLRSTFGAE